MLFRSLFLLFCLMRIGSVDAQTTNISSLPLGKSSFVFVDTRGTNKPMTVYTFRPDHTTVTTPILFVIHGTLRNADAYRDNWMDHAKAKNVVIIAPEFTKKDWPGDSYRHGNLFDKVGKPIDPSLWSYTVIEHLFDQVKALTANESKTYFLYGHSAGGQFVQSFTLFMPNARYERAVAANPGWYTLADEEKNYPAGLKTTLTDTAALAKIMSRNVIVMLGEKDTDPNDPELPKNADAMAEGPYRFARGQFFFKDLQNRAKKMDVPLTWQLHTVPNAGHSDRQMSTAAADLLFPVK